MSFKITLLQQIETPAVNGDNFLNSFKLPAFAPNNMVIAILRGIMVPYFEMYGDDTKEKQELIRNYSDIFLLHNEVFSKYPLLTIPIIADMNGPLRGITVYNGKRVNYTPRPYFYHNGLLLPALQFYEKYIKSVPLLIYND
jgi:hypothetical protein